VADKPDYDASQIQVLEGLEAVRKRPGMYIGSTDSQGLHHLIWEIVDNAVDEATAGHCDRIGITLHDDGSVEVSDNGRGIPVGIEPKTGKSALWVVFSILHAGGKFDQSSYGASGGLHGVGASVVNALAEKLQVTVNKDGKAYRFTFQRGVAGRFDAKGRFTENDQIEELGKTKEPNGTTVRYWTDMTMFPGSDVGIDFDRIVERARFTAFLNRGLTLSLTDARTSEPRREEFCYDGGAADFVEYLSSGEAVTPIIAIQHNDTFADTERVTRVVAETDAETGETYEVERTFNDEVHRPIEIDIALRWVKGYDPTVLSFVNIIRTGQGGKHVEGFEQAVTKACQDAIAATKLLKKSEETPVKDDIQEGLVAVILVRFPEPKFKQQTKDELVTPGVRPAVYRVVKDALDAWLAAPKNKVAARDVLTKQAGAMRARLAARTLKETVRRKQALDSAASLPGKLRDCRSNDLERSEILLVEGDSAMGTGVQARDAEFQALLPLRGKVLNVYKSVEKKMLDNKECQAIIAAMGAGVGKDFDVESIRYGKCILLVDADVDGAHIRTLLLTFFFRYMRPLIEAGRVYAAVPPLHRIETAGPAKEIVYTYTDDEMKKKSAQLEKAGKKIKEVQRYKGLGEMDAEQLAETTLDPDKRTLRRITMTDAKAAEEAFELLMGNAVEPRKDFIMSVAETIDRERLDF
jgi:DNA gyrase subunit B